MSDDLFSKLFDLFDQPGPINWKLAAEVARHLSGETEPVEPWAAEEFRELARLAEYRIEQIAPFRVVPASDVLPLDARGWAERNLESYGSLVEPFRVARSGPKARRRPSWPNWRRRSSGSRSDRSSVRCRPGRSRHSMPASPRSIRGPSASWCPTSRR